MGIQTELKRKSKSFSKSFVGVMHENVVAMWAIDLHTFEHNAAILQDTLWTDKNSKQEKITLTSEKLSPKMRQHPSIDFEIDQK